MRAQEDGGAGPGEVAGDAEGSDAQAGAGAEARMAAEAPSFMDDGAFVEAGVAAAPPTSTAFQEQQLEESFALAAAEGLQGARFCIVMARPWSSGVPPAGVFAPSPGRERLDGQALQDVLARQSPVLVPCSLEHLDEELVAERVVASLGTDRHTCVLMALLLRPGLPLDHETNSRIIAKYSRILGLGFDEVLVNPSPVPDELGRAMGVARSMLELNGRRMQFMLQTEDEPVTHEQLQQLFRRHRRLLWESIPHTLMPHFAPLNRRLVEGPRTLDHYRLVRRMDSVKGHLLLALNEHRKAHVIKVIDKNSVTMLGQLECIYREFRFLSQILTHPHIVHCAEMLHSPTRIYLCMELAGSMNLAQTLQSLPGQRLDEAAAMDAFRQLCSALGFCHGQSIAHRQVSLLHVVVQVYEVGYHISLVDFHKAMMVRSSCTSRTVCGCLPCIAPEVALGKPYAPFRADCWSLGAVLLEMVGGLGSMSRFASYDEQKPNAQEAANNQLQAFAVPGSHADALACVGAVQSDALCSPLTLLLQPEPEQRGEVRKVLAMAERALTPPTPVVVEPAQRQAPVVIGFAPVPEDHTEA